MGESEAKTISSTFGTPKAKPDSEHEAELSKMRHQVAEVFAVRTGLDRQQHVSKPQRKKNPLTEQRRRKIRSVPQNTRLQDYVIELDHKRLQTPLAWREQGCPASYPDAWKVKKFQKFIRNERGNAWKVA